MYFDTHAHYDSGAFNADRKELLASMPQKGVELIVNPGCDLESSRTAVALAEEFSHVYAAVGVHPSDCGEWGEGTLLELRQLASRPKVRAIGEIGLDYYWKNNPPRALQQKDVYKRQHHFRGRVSGKWRLSRRIGRLHDPWTSCTGGAEIGIVLLHFHNLY